MSNVSFTFCRSARHITATRMMNIDPRWRGAPRRNEVGQASSVDGGIKLSLHPQMRYSRVGRCDSDLVFTRGV
jgi:hypothetical protein